MTGENIKEVLANLSEQQASGVLSVEAEQASLEIGFAEGKIVTVSEQGVSASRAVSELLVDAGCLVEEVLEMIAEAEVSVRQLGEVLSSKQYVSLEEFRHALAAYEHNLLHRLSDIEHGEFEFTEGQEVEGAHVSIDPQALVHELAESSELRESFSQLIAGRNLEKVRVWREEAERSDMSAEQLMLWEVTGEHGASLLDLFEMSLLSEHAVMRNLLAMQEQKMLQIEAPEGESVAESGQGEDISEDMDFASSSFDQGFIMPDDDVAANPLMQSVHAWEESAESAEDFLGDDSAVEVDDYDQHAEESVKAEAEAEVEDGDEEEEEEGFPAELEPESSRWAESEQQEFRGLTAFLRSLNYRLLEPKLMQNVVLAMTMIYLLFMAMIAPGQFDNLFKALAEFTSNTA